MNTYTVYDTVGRKVKSVGNYVAQATPPDDWMWREVSGVFGWRLSASNDTLVSHGDNNDQNIISANTYNKAGIVVMTIDVQGKRNFMVYDALNRLVKTVQNAKPDATIEFGVGHPNYDATNDPRSDDYQPLSDPDKDIISQTEYNKAGQVMTTTDPHGTVTEFGYDVAGRRVSITQAEGTALETTSYTCFNKAGWVLRTISNWIDNSTSPDAKTGTAWDFNPSTHGTYNDENLITEYEYDALGRQTKIINPLGEFTSTTYAKDGSVMSVTDPEGTVTAYRYDTLRRRRMVVQGYVANGEDPANWVWDATDGRWEESNLINVKVEHGTDKDQNIIVQLTHDIAGRVTEMRNPLGNKTEYAYDHLNRRVSLTNPLAHTWATSYAELGDGGRRTTQSFPNGYDVVRDFDRMGRLMRVDYGQPSSTPNVQFEYDVLGNRTAMNELGVADDLIRQTVFAYDDARRMTSVGYDSDGDAIINETVSYEYDERGLRTKLTFDGKNITYNYDAKGRLISMTDWDSRTTTFDYDDANRHRLTTRHNAVTSAYAHNTAGQLTDIHHKDSTSATLAHFAYTLNGRGHRTQANETLNGTDTTITYSYDQLARVKNAKYYAGTTPTGTPADEYVYAFDVAGNRLSESHSVNGATPTVTDYDYNDANRVVTRTKNSVVENFGYDANGNLTSIDSLSYTWDRANRLLSHDGLTYTYDGLGNRLTQHNGTTLTEYLIDQQPSLAVVLRQKIGSQNTHYVHGLRGVQSQVANSAWTEAMSDGLGSVRGWLNSSQAFTDTNTFDPYGVPDSAINGFGFTGEMTDANGLVYLRARYYQPNIGNFVSLDPFEGVHNRPMSVNGYSWVEGNVANWSDASGMYQSSNCGYPDSESNISSYVACQEANNEDPCPQTSNWRYISTSYLSAFERNFSICEYRNTGIPFTAQTAWRYETNAPLNQNIRRQFILAYAVDLIGGVADLEFGLAYMTDFEVLARTADYACSFNTTALEVINDLGWLYVGSGDITPTLALIEGVVEALSEALIGSSPSIPINRYIQAPFGSSGGNTNQCRLNTSGLHSDYDDYENQVYHFLPYVQTTANGGAFGSSLGWLGNYVHEDWGIPDFGGGASWQDSNLAYIGMALGLAIRDGKIGACAIGNWIRKYLNQPFPAPSLSTNSNNYPWSRSCGAFDAIASLLGRPDRVYCGPSVPMP